MKKLLINLLAAAAVVLMSTATAMADNMTVNGQNRTYQYYKPANLGENRPLFILCHGYNQDGSYLRNTEFKNDNVSMEKVADSAKFVVVFPDGIDRSWDINGDRDINFIKAIINKMATDHKIDRNRVYMGGFSMGGMLTYHAMRKIPDLIAAYAPISGPLNVTPAANSRPLPLIHTHGTADNFQNVQPALNVWINYNGCPTTAKVQTNYNGLGLATRRTWGPGKDGVEVVLIELKDKGHWVSKEPQVYTGNEIWKFCSRYSLNKTKPSVSITSPKAGTVTAFGPSGSVVFPDITLTATADDPNGTVTKVEFYDGTTLVGTATSKPYTATLTGLKSGKHTLKAVATDNDGETNSTTVEVTLNAPTSLTLSSKFNEANALPVGWATYDSEERRVGYGSGFSQGCRILQFTGSPRSLDYGLYIRNMNGASRQGWAKYGLEESGTTLSMAPGHYSLKYKICNWNNADFNPVDIDIETRTGKQVATTTYTPNINIGNVASNSFGTVAQQTFEFDVTEQGDYVVAVYAAPVSWSDCIIGQLLLTPLSYQTTGISEQPASLLAPSATYTLQGVLTATPTKGLYIRNGKKVVLKL